MSQRIILLTPRRRFLANRFGLGYQLPLGLVFLGGPLVDAGHVVRLIDNDLYGWDTPRLVAEVTRFRPDIVLLGHTGSTAAHPACIATARALEGRLASPPDRLRRSLPLILRGGRPARLPRHRRRRPGRGRGHGDGPGPGVGARAGRWRRSRGSPGATARRSAPIDRARRSAIWTRTAPDGSWWTGRATRCSGWAARPGCSSAGAARSPAPTAASGASGGDTATVARPISSPSSGPWPSGMAYGSSGWPTRTSRPTATRRSRPWSGWWRPTWACR